MSSVLLLICRFSFFVILCRIMCEESACCLFSVENEFVCFFHTWMLFKYECRCVFIVFKFLCVVEMVMSSAYVLGCVCLGGGVMSEVYMLKSLGGRTPLFGTPVLNWRWVDVVFLNVVYAFRPFM